MRRQVEQATFGHRQGEQFFAAYLWGHTEPAIMAKLQCFRTAKPEHVPEIQRLGHLDHVAPLVQMQMPRDEIAGLLAEDFDLSLLRITDEDLDAILRDPDQVEGGAVEGEDDIPEPPVTPVSVTDYLW
jgi:hypothetical protein